MRWTAESKETTHYGNLDLGVHERINNLYDRAFRMASAVAESAAESGCTDNRPTAGARKIKAWDMIYEAHCWNAISDQPEELAACERYERAGTDYEIRHNPDWDDDKRMIVVAFD